jgi:hypothetical protein
LRYLLITFLRKPGGQIDEQVAVAKKVKPADLQTCNVIIDYADKKVSKCVIEGKVVDTSFEKMHEYYIQVYPNLISQLEKEAQITKQEKPNAI